MRINPKLPLIQSGETSNSPTTQTVYVAKYFKGSGPHFCAFEYVNQGNERQGFIQLIL